MYSTEFNTGPFQSQRFRLFSAIPKSGHVANAPRIRRREPKFLGHRVSVEETILIRAAVNARGIGERVVEQEVQAVPSWSW